MIRYEPPVSPEVVLPTHELPIEGSVALLVAALKRQGCLSGGPTHRLGLPLPYGTTANAATSANAASASAGAAAATTSSSPYSSPYVG